MKSEEITHTAVFTIFERSLEKIQGAKLALIVLVIDVPEPKPRRTSVKLYDW